MLGLAPTPATQELPDAYPPAVEIFGLRKEFPTRGWPWPGRSAPKVALDGITLTVDRGERLAILGRNGSGKSTLLRVIATLLTPTAGTVRVGGYPVSAGRRVRAQIGWVTGDERGFYGPLTGRANLEFFAALY